MIVDKVVRIYLDPDNLEEVMESLSLPAFDTECWCEYEEVSKNTIARKFITPDIFTALRSRQIDFIVFKLNC